MNKVNFDGLKNIKAPREWLEKASAVPEGCAKRRRSLPLYRAAAAASIVLVAAISLLSYLFFGTVKAPLKLSGGNAATKGTVSATETSGTPKKHPALPGIVQVPTITESENAIDEVGRSEDSSAAQLTEKDAVIFLEAAKHTAGNTVPAQKERRRSPYVPRSTVASGSSSQRPAGSEAYTPQETVGKTADRQSAPAQAAYATQPHDPADPTTGAASSAERPPAPTEATDPTAAQTAEQPSSPASSNARQPPTAPASNRPPANSSTKSSKPAPPTP